MEVHGRKILAVLGTIFLCSVVLAQNNDSLQDTLRAAVKEDSRIDRIQGYLIKTEEIRAMVSPMGEGDYIRYVQTLPGVSVGADGSSAIYVRGGNLGNNLVTLDGVPIYGTSHLLGFMPVISNDLVSETFFRSGGFASDEGNLTASHIRIRSRDGDWKKLHTGVSLNNFMAGASIDGPIIKDRISFIGACRYSLIGPELKAFDKHIAGISDLNISVYDLFGKLSIRVGNWSRLEGSFFRSNDDYGFLWHENVTDRMGWKNTIANLRWVVKWRGLDFQAGVYQNLKASHQSQEKVAEGALNSFALRDSLKETGIHLKLAWHASHGITLSGGYSDLTTTFNPGSARKYSGNQFKEGSETKMKDNRFDSRTRTLHGQIEYDKGGVWSARGSYRYNLHGAFRKNEFSGSLEYRISEKIRLTCTADKRYQFYHTLEGIPVGWSLDMVIPSEKNLMPESALQLSGNLAFRQREHHFDLGGYWKSMDNLVFLTEASNLFSFDLANWQQLVQTGSGRSFGMETEYSYTGEKMSIRMAYTLSKTDRHFEHLNEGKRFPAKFDRRHILNIEGQWKFAKRGKRESGLSTLVTVQSGCWETVPAGQYSLPLIDGAVTLDYYSTLNNYRMPTFFRWDIGWFLKYKGPKAERELRLGIYNLTNRHNPFMITYDAEEKAWKQISLLPIMPSVSYRLMF